MCTRLVFGLFAMLALLWQPAARADVWAYVNDKGVPHFATERVDERYELYFSDQAPEDSTRAKAVPMAPSRLLAFFEISPDYKAVRHLLREAARTHRIDYALLQALIATESGFDATAVSPKGAVGLMQLMPATAQRFGVEASRQRSVQQQLADPAVNVPAGARYLNHLMGLFPGRLDLVLAAYNAGEGAVRRAGQAIPPYQETRNYVKAVLGIYEQLQGGRQRAGQAAPVAAQPGTAPRIRMTLSTGLPSPR